MTPPEQAQVDRLDEAIRDTASTFLDEDGTEIVVSWIAVAATRRLDGGGAVIAMPCDGTMPNWQARGLLSEALVLLDGQYEDDE